MTLETLIVSVGLLGALQTAYVTLKSMEAKTATGPEFCSAETEAFFTESETDKTARKMKKDFDLARAKSIMSLVSQFGEKKIEI